MPEPRLAWVESLPEIGNDFINRGRKIAARKIELARERVQLRDAEVQLWIDIGETGKWSNAELCQALMLIGDFSVVSELPELPPGKED